jgi:hypothetical protein
MRVATTAQEPGPGQWVAGFAYWEMHFRFDEGSGSSAFLLELLNGRLFSLAVVLRTMTKVQTVANG